MRLIHALAFLAVLSLPSLSVLGAQPAEEKAEADRLFDGFDGKLALDWKQIRAAPTHQSLTKSPGKLTITTQYGSIHRTGRPQLAKNLFLIDIPERDQADFVVTTILDGFRPQMPYNQAGLLIYKDDDNYLKFTCEFSSAGVPIFNTILEQDGESVINNLRVPFDLERLWLRVIKRGNLYECSSSNDGENFTAYADLTWDDSPSQVGLLAKNGSLQEAGEVDAHFDSFEFRALTAEEKEDPAQVARLKLPGVWNVVSGRLSGKEMTNPAMTNVTIEPGRFILREKTRSATATFVVDTSSTPTALKVYIRSGATLTPLNWAYEVDGDTLVLCTILKPNAETPDSLETKEGDGRMLLTLHRAKAEE